MLVNRIEPVASLNSWASAEVGKGIVCRTLYQAAGRRAPGFQTVVWPFAEESTNGLTASLSLFTLSFRVRKIRGGSTHKFPPLLRPENCVQRASNSHAAEPGAMLPFELPMQ